MVSQRVPQLLYRAVQTVLKLDKRISRPQLGPQLFACDHGTGASQQHLQNLKRLLLHLDSDARLMELPCSQVRLEQAEAHSARHVGWFLHETPP